MISWRFCILTISLLFSITVFSQDSQQQLEAKRKKLEKEIVYTNKLLNQTQLSKDATVNQLRLLNVKVNQRNDLIATLDSEVYHIKTKIEEIESLLFKLNEELSNLKQKYATIAWHAYKYSTAYSKLIFLFSAEDLNQA